MADGTGIEWTEATWNPVTGCDRVSPGCAHCYALDLAARLKRMGNRRYQNDGDPKSSGPGFGVTLHEDVLQKPLRWRRPRRIFVNSMSDLFHEEVPDEFIAEVFAVMYIAGQHTFQVLTKRPERMAGLLNDPEWQGKVLTRRHKLGAGAQPLYSRPWPIPNVWLGVSIENRRFVHRADLLRETPAAVRFISAEPLLGPLVSSSTRDLGNSPGEHRPGRVRASSCTTRRARILGSSEGLDLTDIDWLIVGGESGGGHRRINPQWVRELRDLCLSRCPLHPLGLCNGEAECNNRPAFFFKQWGGHTPKAGGRRLDGRTWDEFPDLTSQRAA